MKHSEEHYRLFFGKQANYYLSVMADVDAGKTVVINGFAFFFGVFWMLFRKMYMPVLVVTVLIFLESTLETEILTAIDASVDTIILVDKIAMFVWPLLISLFGNKLYVGHTNRKISNIVALSLTEEETNNRIIKAGGTTLIPHAVILIVSLIIGYFLYEQGHIG